MAAADGAISSTKLEWLAGASVCVVMASRGYPGAYETGKEIRGVETAEATGATVFHAGTRLASGRLETAGGRVLGGTVAVIKAPMWCAVKCSTWPSGTGTGVSARRPWGIVGPDPW